MEKWLENLKVGDKVFVNFGCGKKVKIVDKVSNTHRITIGSTVFNNDGYERGSSFCGNWLTEYSEEEEARYNKEQREKKFVREVKNAATDKLRYSNITVEQAKALDVIFRLGLSHKFEV